MSKAVMRRVAAEEKDYFWLEIEVLPTDKIVREINGGRLRTMMYPEKGVGMGMEFKLESHYLRKRTNKGNLKRGWPVGFVRVCRVDFGMMRHYLHMYKGSGRHYATSCHLNGVL